MLEAAQAKQTNQTDIRHMLAGSTPRRNNCFSIYDNPQHAQTASADDRRVTVAGANSSPPSARRSILKRISTGASTKRVSFSRSNEVCSFLKNRTAKSLFPPFTVNVDDGNLAPTEVQEASSKVDVCEKSFHEDPEELPENAENEDDRNVSFGSVVNNSVRLELPADEDDEEGSPVRKVLFETGNGDQEQKTEPDVPEADFDVENEEFVDAMSVTEDSGCNPTPLESAEGATATSSTSMDSTRAEPPQPTPELNLVDLIKSADGDQRKQMLAHVSSPEFLAKMSSQERNAFAIRVFASIGFYVQ